MSEPSQEFTPKIKVFPMLLLVIQLFNLTIFCLNPSAPIPRSTFFFAVLTASGALVWILIKTASNNAVSDQNKPQPQQSGGITS